MWRGVWGVEYRLDAKISSLRAAILKYLCLLHFGSKTSERANFGLTGPKSVGLGVRWAGIIRIMVGFDLLMGGVL